MGRPFSNFSWPWGKRARDEFAGLAEALVALVALIVGRNFDSLTGPFPRSRTLVWLAAVVLVTGTVVTGAGPHSGGGKRDDVSRLDLRIPDVARVHGTMVMIFLGAVLVMVWLLRRDRAPHPVQQRVTVLLVVLVAQAGVGYAQYFNDIPAVLVGIHIAGATAVWSATVVLYLGLFERTAMVPVTPPPEPLLAQA